MGYLEAESSYRRPQCERIRWGQKESQLLFGVTSAPPPIVISLSLLRQTRQETMNGEIHRLLSREIDGLINSFIRSFVRSFPLRFDHLLRARHCHQLWRGGEHVSECPRLSKGGETSAQTAWWSHCRSRGPNRCPGSPSSQENYPQFPLERYLLTWVPSLQRRRGGWVGESRPILEGNCVLPFPKNHPKGAPSPSSFLQGDPWLTPLLGRHPWGSGSTLENSSMETEHLLYFPLPSTYPKNLE